MVTITDVCRLANVSKATVSRVLSGNRKVREDTRVAVMKAVEELNYRPNQLAQTLTTKVSNIIGVLVYGLDDLRLGKNIRQLEYALSLSGRSMIVANYVVGKDTLEQKLSSLASRHCDAILLIGDKFESSWFDELDTALLPPLLTMDFTLENIAGVPYDLSMTSEMAFNYLYSQGHRQIAMLPESGIAGEQALEGYRRALDRHCLPLNPQLLLRQSDPSSGVIMLINRYVPFTAILAMHDVQAMEIIRTLEQYNIAVPQEVSVICLQTDIEGGRYSPAISGFQAPKETMMETLMVKLENIMAKKNTNSLSEQEQSTFTGKLVIRESVARLPG